MAKQTRHVVATTAELPPGTRKLVMVNDHEIGVFNVGGSYYALLNRCPHRAGPLCKGRLRPLVLADEVRQVEYTREDEILKCPWHQWEFDLKTGVALYDAKLRVRTYRVVQEEDTIALYL
jgi:nitrite reductase (NADH) small subunit